MPKLNTRTQSSRLNISTKKITGGCSSHKTSTLSFPSPPLAQLSQINVDGVRRAAVPDEAMLPLEGLLAHGALVGQPVLIVQHHVALHDEVVAQHLVADGAFGGAKPLFR